MSSVSVSVGSAVALTQSFVRGEDPVAALVDIARRGGSADQVRLPIERLKSWQAAGAALVLLDLPRPGRLGLASTLPSSSRDAALAAGEVLIVADGSGALIPGRETYGPIGDRGTSLTWHHVSAAPVPEYRYRLLDRRQVEQELIEAVQLASRALTGLRRGWGTSGSAAGPRTVALPHGIPAALQDLIGRAAALASMALDGLAEQELSSSVDLHAATRRGAALRALASAATAALVDATNLAALAVADSGG